MLRWYSNTSSVAMMARPVAGVRKKTVIVTVPGSPKGARENLGAIVKFLPHACRQAAGINSRAMHIGGVRQLEKDAGVTHGAAGMSLSNAACRLS
jgi:gephyrin